jgi:hypothetical protein
MSKAAINLRHSAAQAINGPEMLGQKAPSAVEVGYRYGDPAQR